MKRMGWDDQMRDLKSIDQVHVLSGDVWRGWDGMIRPEILNQLTKFTYQLETDEEDGMRWSDRDIKNTKIRTSWRWMKRMGWDDKMRDLKPIDQDHVLPRDGWRGWDGMIRWEILNQLTKFTYFLETDEEDGDDQMRDLKPIDKITYSLETDEEDEIWWSDERY